MTYTSLLVTPVVGLLPCIPKYLAETMTRWFRLRQLSLSYKVLSAGLRTIMPTLRSGLLRPNASHRCFVRWMRSTYLMARIPGEVDLSDAPYTG